MNNFSRFLVICYIVIIVCLGHGKAAGHAFPVRSEPKTGETVHASPPQVRIWFDSVLEPASSTIVVQDSNGKKVDKGGRWSECFRSDTAGGEPSSPSLGNLLRYLEHRG